MDAIAIVHRILCASNADEILTIACHAPLMRALCRSVSLAMELEDSSVMLLLRSMSILGSHGHGGALRCQGCLQRLLFLAQMAPANTDKASSVLQETMTTVLCVFGNEWGEAIPLHNKAIEAAAVPQWLRILQNRQLVAHLGPSLLANMRDLMWQLQVADRPQAPSLDCCPSVASITPEEPQADDRPTRVSKRKALGRPSENEMHKASLRIIAFWPRTMRTKQSQPLTV